MKTIATLLIATFLLCTSVSAAELNVPMHKVSKDGKSGLLIGMINLKDTQYGLLITPYLHHLKTGFHGFHVHAKSSCADNGMAAGGHFDPMHTGKHLGPYSDKGHLGDLPRLYVNESGDSIVPMLAPRLSLEKIRHHALMIHADGDNYSDFPKKLGGGGARVACSVIK